MMNKPEGLDAMQDSLNGKYRVDLRSVLDSLRQHFDDDAVEHDRFEDALELAIEALEDGVDDLACLVKRLKAAKRFEDLDLGWHEPLLTRVEDGGQVRLL